MKIRILTRHPISNPTGPSLWDGEVYDYGGSLLDVESLGRWLTGKVGIRFDYRPGTSRVVDDHCVFFPKRRTTGVHCMWVREYEEPPPCRIWTNGLRVVEKQLGDLHLQVTEEDGHFLKTEDGSECFAEIRYQDSTPTEPSRLAWQTVYRGGGFRHMQMLPVGRGKDMPGSELLDMYRQASGDPFILDDMRRRGALNKEATRG